MTRAFLTFKQKARLYNAYIEDGKDFGHNVSILKREYELQRKAPFSSSTWSDLRTYCRNLGEERDGKRIMLSRLMNQNRKRLQKPKLEIINQKVVDAMAEIRLYGYSAQGPSLQFI
jgi:hypothetical protein